MSKNLNKIVAFAIGVSVFTGNVVPAMAADTKVTIMNEAAVITNNNSKPLLTLEDAMETAVSNS